MVEIDSTITDWALFPFAAFSATVSPQDSNPTDRPDTFSSPVGEPLAPACWSIDGGDPYHFRFFAYPDFARGRRPTGITIVVPLDQMAIDHNLRHELQLSRVFSSSRKSVPDLPLARHLIAALSNWSCSMADFQSTYFSMPFGSQIVVSSLHKNVREMQIQFDPSYELERRWLSLELFNSQTDLDISQAAEPIALSSLNFIRQIHDSTSVINLPQEGGSKEFIFKAVTTDVQHMYHELRTLLSLPAHPNVISRPRYFVLKPCQFGGKSGICGFILEYFDCPSLQHALTLASDWTLGDRLTLARGITQGLLHIRDCGPGFYSDLKPSNILLPHFLRARFPTPMIIDFEQRGSWFDWSPPEVRYIEYMHLLACSSRSGAFRNRYQDILDENLPEWSVRWPSRPLMDAPHGYSLGWTSLNAQERNSAQVFGLGKLLWCIFEGQPSCNNFLTIETLAEGIEQEQRFPEFRHTPHSLRYLIRSCTAGSLEWTIRSFPLSREGSHLMWVGGASQGLKQTCDYTSLQQGMRDWWIDELSMAETYLRGRSRNVDTTSSDRNFARSRGAEARQRPSLEEIDEILMQALNGTP